MKTQPLAYSYVRFSTPEQAKGDSLRRQTEAAADYCKRHTLTLDTSTTLHDLGRSAFLGDHRKNPDRNALASFLKLVEQGKVPRGSFLILESLDRLSREHIRPALTLLLQLIEAGVRVVQLIPVEGVYDDKVEPMQLMMAIMELSRGHSESAVKSERVGAAWADKKTRARAGKHIITHKLPAWVQNDNGTLRLIPAAAAAVRRVYELARSGYGHVSIAKKLTADKVPAIGTTGVWCRSYIAVILKDRRAVGEFQPRDRAGRADGTPIAGYFPAVVSEEDWLAARSATATRRQPGTTKGRAGAGMHNIFAGLVTDARDGGSYYAVQRLDSGPKRWVLINTRSAEGRATCVSFPLEAFEQGVLSQLREIDPRDIIETSAPSNTATLAADLAREEEDIARLERELESAGESIPAVVRVLAKKEARRKELADALASARATEATPASAAWGEFGTLLDVMASAADRDETRRRLRAVLRRMASGIWLLAVANGRTRLAAVRVQFAGSDQHRDYLIEWRPRKANAKASVEPSLSVQSLAFAGSTELDLRQPDHARRLEALIRAMPRE